jgi:hypothetical protein
MGTVTRKERELKGAMLPHNILLCEIFLDKGITINHLRHTF